MSKGACSTVSSSITVSKGRGPRDDFRGIGVTLVFAQYAGYPRFTVTSVASILRIIEPFGMIDRLRRCRSGVPIGRRLTYIDLERGPLPERGLDALRRYLTRRR